MLFFFFFKVFSVLSSLSGYLCEESGGANLVGARESVSVLVRWLQRVLSCTRHRHASPEQFQNHLRKNCRGLQTV